MDFLIQLVVIIQSLLVDFSTQQVDPFQQLVGVEKILLVHIVHLLVEVGVTDRVTEVQWLLVEHLIQPVGIIQQLVVELVTLLVLSTHLLVAVVTT